MSKNLPLSLRFFRKENRFRDGTEEKRPEFCLILCVSDFRHDSNAKLLTEKVAESRSNWGTLTISRFFINTGLFLVYFLAHYEEDKRCYVFLVHSQIVKSFGNTL